MVRLKSKTKATSRDPPKMWDDLTRRAILFILLFSVSMTIKIPDWEVCLAGNIAGENCEAPFIFYRKMWRMVVFLQIYYLQWVVQAVNKCQQNRENKCVCFIQTDVYLSKVEIISRDLSPLVVHALPQMKHSSLYLRGCDVDDRVIETLLSYSVRHPACNEVFGYFAYLLFLFVNSFAVSVLGAIPYARQAGFFSRKSEWGSTSFWEIWMRSRPLCLW